MEHDVETYLSRFAARDLGPDSFDHRGHLFMAWAHLDRFEFEEASQRVCDGIRDLAIKFEAPEKYNYTLTQALMMIMAQRMKKEEPMAFPSFLATNQDLVKNAQGLLAHHYSDVHLNSDVARKGWVEPDLAPIE